MKQAGEGRMIATLSDYQQTFRSEAGTRVLRHLMKVHGILGTSYVEKDSLATAFNEGGRNVVIQIIRKLQIDIKKLEAELYKDPQGDSDVII